MTRFLLLATIVFLSPLPVAAIFYGEDDYVEIDQIDKLPPTRVDWATIAKSVAILLDDRGPEEIDLSGAKTMRQRFRNPTLDPNYKYGDQVSVARGTAFLVGKDKIMTAGHFGKRGLQRSVFLFDFTWDSKTKRLRKTRYRKSEIYRCEKVLLHRDDNRGDYAICKLDKPVAGRQPLKLEVFKNAAAIDMKPAKMISAPDGTPLKLTNKGCIWGKRPSKQAPKLDPTGFFFHDLDNSGGSSGAPIFDATTGRVIGIQSGGDDNFTTIRGVAYPTSGDMRRSNLGRPLKGEWGSLIPEQALEVVRRK